MMNLDKGIIELEKLTGLMLVETKHGFIVPAGYHACYSLNKNREVIGIKLGSFVKSQKDSFSYNYLLDRIIFFFPKLERLVLIWEADELSEHIAELEELKYLWIGGRVKIIPEEILKLKLEIFNTSNKDTSSVLFDIVQQIESEDITNQKKIDNDLYNEIINKSDNIKYYNESLHESGIFIDSSAIVDPPLELISKGRGELELYFLNRQKGEKPINEVKVILVGEGGSGKTSLMNRILAEKFNPKEKQTHGINIKSLTNKKLKINFWDFGGQEIMHSTHQFFLSKRSFYILVLDGRKEEDPEYWLKHIQSFGGNSPVLIVLNKIDQNPAFEVNRRFLSDKYKNIVGYARISCATNFGYKIFMKSMFDEINRVQILSTNWPITWFRVKAKLESLSASFISFKDFHSICQTHGINDTKSIDVFVGFLNDLGIILHFDDLDLLDTHVLDPKWVTEGVYRLINSNELNKQQGIISPDQISEVLTVKKKKGFIYPKHTHNYLVKLMLKFELCYLLEDESLLVPDLLSIQEPEIEPWSNDFIFLVFDFSYLPKSIIARFIVRVHKDIVGSNRWRTGVYLKDNNFEAEAIVKADIKENNISIQVRGKNGRDYLTIIRKTIYDIITSYKKLEYSEKVPIPDTKNLYIEYTELIGYERAGRDSIFIGKIGKDLNVFKLLDGIEKKEERAVQIESVSFTGDFYFDSSNNKTIITKNMKYTPFKWERIVVYLSGIIFLGIIMFLLVRNEAIIDPNLVVFTRIILSLVVSAFGATIPGFLNVSFNKTGVAIRAGGALALFVITYLLTPTVL